MTSRFPIQPQPLSAAIADRLRQQILAGHYPPGSDLLDGDIAVQLGVSRTPVREAMKQLCHEGLLTAHPRRGMVIATVTPEQMDEAQQLLEVLTQHFVQHPCVRDGLGQRMLEMVQSQLQLAQISR